MSTTTPVEPKRPPAGRLGPRLAGAIAAGGVLLLMLFALVAARYGAIQGLALAAGTAAISTVVWVIRRIVIAFIPGDNGDRPSTPDSAMNDVRESARESEEIR